MKTKTKKPGKVKRWVKGDPAGNARRAHKKHIGIGAIHRDCVECNPFADERTFLLMSRKVLGAALDVVFAANQGSLFCAHPWLKLQEEIRRRLNDLRDQTDTTRREDNEILIKLFKDYETEIKETA